jgi:hypothetical protein
LKSSGLDDRPGIRPGFARELSNCGLALGRSQRDRVDSRAPLTGDREFESGSLQRRVCKPSVPRNLNLCLRLTPPNFGAQPRCSKWRIAVMLGFKRFRNAAITIAGVELMHPIPKGQFGLGRLGAKPRVADDGAVWNATATGGRPARPTPTNRNEAPHLNKYYAPHARRTL